MERKLAMEFVKVTEAAALAASQWIGRGDKEEADRAAVDAMRASFNTLDIDGVVVIGEGEIDEAPMLYIGEELGTKKGPRLDIAVDPLDGTTVCSKGKDNAIAVMAIAKRGHLLHAPDMYMDKIAVGPGAKGVIDINASTKENIRKVAKALGKDIRETVLVALDRPRHRKIIADALELGARINLIGDGDVAGAICTALDHVDGDILLGVGGAPEGVIAAAALRSLGGEMQARLAPMEDAEIHRAERMGIDDIGRVYEMDDLAKGDAIFIATGVTNGCIVRGVQKENGVYRTHSFITVGGTDKYHFIETVHNYDPIAK